jgi:hypothetical protein
VDPLEGTADSGNLSDDLTDLLVALGEGAEERETGVAFLLDEVQFLEPREFEALIAALHRTVQRELPITLDILEPEIWIVRTDHFGVGAWGCRTHNRFA